MIFSMRKRFAKKKNEKPIKDFQAFIDAMVDEEVSRKTDKIQMRLDEVIYIVEGELARAAEFYDKMKSEGLTVNAIEAEGAYRGLLGLWEELKPYHPKEEVEDAELS